MSKRLCNNSPNETVFQYTKYEYQEALRKSGYMFTLKSKPKNTHSGEKQKQAEIIYGSIHHLVRMSPQT